MNEWRYCIVSELIDIEQNVNFTSSTIDMSSNLHMYSYNSSRPRLSLLRYKCIVNKFDEHLRQFYRYYCSVV